MKTSIEIGKYGEYLAAEYLKKKKYKIIDKNYYLKNKNSPIGEIDIISKKGDKYVFFEIKTMTNTNTIKNIFYLEKRVDNKKAKKIILTAKSWLTKNKIPLENTKWQIDIIGVIIADDANEFIHLENCFEDK